MVVLPAAVPAEDVEADQVSEADAAESSQPTVQQIVDCYLKKYDAITTLLVDTRLIERKPLIDESRLWEDYGQPPALPMETSFLHHRDGRFYGETRAGCRLLQSGREFVGTTESPAEHFPRWKLPFAYFKSALLRDYEEILEECGGEIPPLIQVFDGEKDWKHESWVRREIDGESRPVYQTGEIISGTGMFLPICVTHRMALAFPVPKLNMDHIFRMRSGYLPQFMADKMFELRPDLVDVDGHACLVLGTSSEQLMLDPEADFTVRKRMWTQTTGTLQELMFEDLEEVLPDLWLPRKVIDRRYGFEQLANGRHHWIPIFEDHLEITRIEVNEPEHLSRFSLEVPAGAVVIDHTLLPLREDFEGDDRNLMWPREIKLPPTTYIRPADPEELESVILAARLEEGARITSQRAQQRREAVAQISRSTQVAEIDKQGRDVMPWIVVGIIATAFVLMCLRVVESKQ